MTQPYTPPPYPYQPYPMMAVDPHRPFKRASLLMFILGGLMLLFAGCTAMVSRVSLDQFPPEQRAELERVLEPMGYDMQSYLMTAAAVIAVPALLMVGLGVGVRSGGRGWVVGSLVVTGLLLLFLGLSILLAFVSGNAQTAIANLCVLSVPLGLLILLFALLLSANRAAGQPGMIGNYYQPVPQAYPPVQAPVAPPPSGYGYGYAPPATPQAPSNADQQGQGPNPPAPS